MAGPRGATLAALLLLPLLASGCLGGVFQGGPETHRTFSCAVLDPEGSPTLLIRFANETPLSLHRYAALLSLQEELANVTGRSPADIPLESVPPPAAPPEGWTQESLETLAQAHSFRVDRNTVGLSITWLSELPHVHHTAERIAPGWVVLSEDAIGRVVGRTAADAGTVERAVLFHIVGRALGQVNDGIPMLEDHEARPPHHKHEDDPASVLHWAWMDDRTAAPAPGVAYDHYPETAREDWRTATSPGGVCT